jgi:hypothetical protein
MKFLVVLAVSVWCLHSTLAAEERTYDDMPTPFLVPEEVHAQSFNSVFHSPKSGASKGHASKKVEPEAPIAEVQAYLDVVAKMAQSFDKSRSCDSVNVTYEKFLANQSYYAAEGRLASSSFDERVRSALAAGSRLREQVVDAREYCRHYVAKGLGSDSPLVAMLAAAHAEVSSLERDPKLSHFRQGVCYYPDRSPKEVATLLSGLRTHAEKLRAAGIDPQVVTSLILRYNAVMAPENSSTRSKKQ